MLRKCLILVLLSSLARAEVVECDILVFGGTAGGVSAACTAARFGKKVVLTELAGTSAD
jgi:succinate dehydrogenase/fumarate reductase flavoprotein subunit